MLFSRPLSFVAAALATACALVIPGEATAQRPSKPSNLTSYLTGNSADSPRQPVGGPALILMGGNYDIDEAFQNRVYPVANGGDIVVLRTNKSNGYQSYLYNMSVPSSIKPDSVETIVVDTVSKANSAYVSWVLSTAEFIYIAGGDQSAYLNAWKNTGVETAIRSAYNRGAVVGGISAGCAVMGEFIYDPDGVTAVISSEAIANPYRSSMILSSGFLDLPLGNDIITDTHFFERGRMGRSMAFMARLRKDGTTAAITGVCVDEDTSLFIDKNRFATCDGDGAVYILREDGTTTRDQVVSGQPLIYRNVLRTKITANQTFNFATGVGSTAATRLSVDGRNASNPYTPTNPY